MVTFLYRNYQPLLCNGSTKASCIQKVAGNWFKVLKLDWLFPS